jgi:hypothetical protein
MARDSRLIVNLRIIIFFDHKTAQQVLDCNESLLEITQVVLYLEPMGALQTVSLAVILH